MPTTAACSFARFSREAESRTSVRAPEEGTWEGGAAEPNLSHPHNWILHVWLQLGLLGLGAFCWLLWRFWRLASAGLRQGADRWMVAAALGSMADTLVHGLIDNSYFLVDLSFLFWLTLALVVPAAHRSTRTAQATP